MNEMVTQIPATYRISVKALILNDKNEVLLTEDAETGWDLPGGGLNHGEDPIEGLKREVAEELGVKIKNIATRPIDFWTIFKPGRADLCYFGFVLYAVELVDENFKFGDDAIGAKFFSVEAAKQLALHPNIQPFFHSYKVK